MRISVSLPVLILVALSACPVGSALAQQRIYQWQDATGRTHYSSTPPASGRYSVRGVHARDMQPAAAAAGTDAAKEPPQCAPARRNLELLRGEGIVQMDSDGDGKPDKTLDDQGRANQLALAQATLAASCSSGSQPAPAGG